MVVVVVAAAAAAVVVVVVVFSALACAQGDLQNPPYCVSNKTHPGQSKLRQFQGLHVGNLIWRLLALKTIEKREAVVIFTKSIFRSVMISAGKSI